MPPRRNPEFIPGLELSKAFYTELVGPILTSRFPHLRYTAALIGPGSEVLGFDTEMSSDHHWGPRVLLFLSPDDRRSLANEIRDILSRELPTSFCGYPTNFAAPPPDDPDVVHLEWIEEGPVRHRVEIHSFSEYFASYVGLQLDASPTVADWLSLPQQKLRTLVAGGVFRDDLGLEAIRVKLQWYPEDVWRYILAGSWSKIGEEEHLMGRAGYVGDEIGSALLGASLVRESMRLAFLIERVYPPYPKWFGTAFSKLALATTLSPSLESAIHARNWKDREEAIVTAFSTLTHAQNELALAPKVSSDPSQFWGRPFRVIHGDRISEALLGAIQSPEMLEVAHDRGIGSVDTFTSSTDLLEDTDRRAAIARLYESRLSSNL